MNDFFNKHNYIFITVLIILKYTFVNPQINDEFSKGILEDGDYDLIDITDYKNLNILVTTSKKIYKGIPPELITTTNAKLISSSSIITVNSNYLLAACLQDSLLTRININTGVHASLLDYSSIEANLPAASTICSLSSNNNNEVFIGYSKLENNSGQTNKKNIVVKVQLTFNSDEPSVNIYSKKVVYYPNSVIKTPSSRQIVCESLKIKNTDNYRLVCLYEDKKYDSGYQSMRYYLYGTVINENFDGFTVGMDDENNRIYRSNVTSGFKLFKIDDYNAKCFIWKLINKISLNSETEIHRDKENFEFKASLDLYDYQSGFFFFADKINYMNKNDIYSITIKNIDYSNNFTFYDYQENSINKLFCKYNQENNYFVIIYKCSDKIKYISLKFC